MAFRQKVIARLIFFLQVVLLSLTKENSGNVVPCNAVDKEDDMVTCHRGLSRQMEGLTTKGKVARLIISIGSLENYLIAGRYILVRKVIVVRHRNCFTKINVDIQSF